MKGFDCSTPLSLKQSKGIKAAGYDFVPRYLVPSRFTKYLSHQESVNLTAAELWIVSVFEWYETRPNEGYAAGLADGEMAFICAKDVEQPEDSAIYFAVDYDAQPNDYDAIENYFKGAAQGIQNYSIGGYGSEAVMEEMYRRGVIKHIWQTKAWSRRDSVHRNIFQAKNGIVVAGVTGDLNYSYGNEGWWNLVAKPTVDFDQDAATKVINVMKALYGASADTNVENAAHYAADALRDAVGLPKQ